VKVNLLSESMVSSSYDYSYVDAAAGSVTFQPLCSGYPVWAGGNGVSCTFGLPTFLQCRCDRRVLGRFQCRERARAYRPRPTILGLPLCLLRAVARRLT
jgi:hypothetical protein